MRARLAELSKVSAALRFAAKEKKSGLLGSALSFVGKKALQHPITTVAGSVGAVAGVKGAQGQYKQYKSGFDPNLQQAMQGPPPVGG